MRLVGVGWTVTRLEGSKEEMQSQTDTGGESYKGKLEKQQVTNTGESRNSQKIILVKSRP